MDSGAYHETMDLSAWIGQLDRDPELVLQRAAWALQRGRSVPPPPCCE